MAGERAFPKSELGATSCKPGIGCGMSELMWMKTTR
jgi:hypothetical protein